jgi:hypothetical protein
MKQTIPKLIKKKCNLEASSETKKKGDTCRSKYRLIFSPFVFPNGQPNPKPKRSRKLIPKKCNPEAGYRLFFNSSCISRP